MDASELKAARERLLLKRNEIIKGLRARNGRWLELHQVCREIVEMETKLGTTRGQNLSRARAR